MTDDDARRRFASARVARLATVTAGNDPHLVPICFAVQGDTIYSAVDAKPKTTRDLKRLRNIEANPRVTLLVDHYEDDWEQVWWVRVDGTAHVVDDHDDGSCDTWTPETDCTLREAIIASNASPEAGTTASSRLGR